MTMFIIATADLVVAIILHYRDVKKEDENVEEVKKKVPLSLEEILAKKKAEEEALSKVFYIISYWFSMY
jgi:hypothetical protein